MQLSGGQMRYVHAGGESTPKAMQKAFEHYQAGLLPQAEVICQQILQMVPSHPDALHLRGVIAHQVGRNDLAVDLITRAVSANPSNPNYYNHLGMALKNHGKLDAAIASYRKALSFKPDFAEAHNNLGNALTEQGKLDEAVASYRKALSIRADFAGAHYNLGNALTEQGKLDEAIAAYRMALSDKPDFAEAHDNLGTALLATGKVEEAAASYRKALSFKPNYAAAHNNLGNLLNQLGEVDAALASYKRALGLEEAPEFKANFARCIASTKLIRADADVRRLLTRAVAEAWVRPTDLAKTSSRLVLFEPHVRECVERALSAWPVRLRNDELFGTSGLAVLASDLLLQSLLENAPVTEIPLERFLTTVRHAMLDVAVRAAVGDYPDDKALIFYCALARQCFINEFIFSYIEEEITRARALQEKLAVAVQARTEVPALWIVAVAAYFPLLSLPHVETLLDQSWPPAVAALLAQQITEPLEERRYRDTATRLTAVENDVSRLVQQQYEENPYPRWIKAAPQRKASSINGYLQRQFPCTRFEPLNRGSEIDILIAGCGTGQEPIETARQFPKARVLAVDLSLASLGYALRKTRELGLQNIDYAQADIMKLAALGRTFDAILSIGVLHHLADPVAGWRVLVSLLRPSGFMRLGLYSERARQSIVTARQFIAERGYASTVADIRRLREDLMSLKSGPDLRHLCGFRDFFVTSECRDLLFHVQEHRFTVRQIKQILETLKLTLIGFSLEPHDMKKYRERFPDDNSRTNLDYWHDFETQFPNTFLGMYQFWVQKASR